MSIRIVFDQHIGTGTDRIPVQIDIPLVQARLGIETLRLPGHGGEKRHCQPVQELGILALYPDTIGIAIHDLYARQVVFPQIQKGTLCAGLLAQPPIVLFHRLRKVLKPQDVVFHYTRDRRVERRQGKALVAIGRLSVSNLRTLEIYCASYSRLRAAWAKIHDEGLVVETQFTKKANPALAIQDQASKEMRKALAELLGIETEIEKDIPPNDPLFDFMNQAKKLRRVNPRNDGMMIIEDQLVPGSSLLGCANGDHWAVAVPIARSHPHFASLFVDDNDYPREALLEAIFRFIEEDLGESTR